MRNSALPDCARAVGASADAAIIAVNSRRLNGLSSRNQVDPAGAVTTGRSDRDTGCESGAAPIVPAISPDGDPYFLVEDLC